MPRVEIELAAIGGFALVVGLVSRWLRRAPLSERCSAWPSASCSDPTSCGPCHLSPDAARRHLHATRDRDAELARALDELVRRRPEKRRDPR